MRIETNNSWINVRQFGPVDATNILLISGFIGVSSFWDSLLPVLSEKHRVTVFDQRGSGESGAYDQPLTMQQMADDAVLVLDTLSSAPVHLIGHSAGSGVSMILANMLPGLIQSISLLAGWTKADPWMERVFAVRLEALNNSGPESYAALTTLFMNPYEDVSKQNMNFTEAETVYAKNMPAKEEISERAQAVLEFDSRKWNGGVFCSVLVIGAEDDAMTPYYFSEKLASSMPQAQLCALKTGGHYFPRTRADDAATELLKFLDGEKDRDKEKDTLLHGPFTP